MEGQPTVSYTAGSMNSLIEKLTKLKNPPVIIRELRRDLVTLHEDLFDKLARRRETNSQVSTWVRYVSELVFDIEDWIDQNPAAAAAAANTRHEQLEIEQKVKNFKVSFDHIVELCERYELVTTTEASTGLLHDPYAVPICKITTGSRPLDDEKPTVVRVHCLMNEIVLKYGTSDCEKRLRVVSIAGMAGIGKTTLAKEIYARLQGEFECRAFVTLGRRPSMRKTLVDILRQVKSSPLATPHTPKKENVKGGRGIAGKHLRNLLAELWEYIATKRYFILVDGVWSKRAWRTINSALPNENRGSLVLTTTCISDVAKRCSVRPTDIYWMEDLSKKSLCLDPDRDRQTEWPSHCDDFTRNILRMCDDMPLAITIATGLLTVKCHRELAELGMPIISSAEKYFTSKGVMKLLQMSYAALSLPMKCCLLYLSVFREDYIIKKDRLIRLWIAEGFIPRKDKQGTGQQTREESISLWESGERCFNKLITRRLIQPVFSYDDDQAVGCTVHGLVLQFIKELSSKGNFVTFGADLSSGLFPGSMHTVRRLSLDLYDDQDQDGTLASVAVHLWKVRSITVLGDVERNPTRSALAVSGKIQGPSVLPSFKLIRVLDLEDTML